MLRFFSFELIEMKNRSISKKEIVLMSLFAMSIVRKKFDVNNHKRIKRTILASGINNERNRKIIKEGPLLSNLIS